MKTVISRAVIAPCVVAAGALVLAACQAQQAPAEAASTPAEAPAARASGGTEPTVSGKAAVVPAASFKLAVDGEGLRLVQVDTGSTRPLAFGAAQTQVLSVLEAQRGAAAQGLNGECNNDYANWADGLRLTFQDGLFVGWALDERAADAISTMAGVGPGSTRADLDGAYSATVSQTSLGTEFSAGDLSGVLDGTGAGAKITNMWAGVNCIAR